MGERAPSAPLRRRAFPLALVALCGAGSLVAMELLVRLLSDEGKTLLVRDPRFGQTYLPSFEGSRFVPESGRHVRLRFNREGFRGADRRHGRAAGIHRLVVLGDSFTAGVGVEEGDHFCTLLETRLTADLHETWEVLNFGVSGAGTTQAVLIYEEVARRYQPDVVLLCFFHGNDLADNLLAPSRQPRFELEPGGTLALWRPGARREALERWLNAHSELYVWLLNKRWQLEERRRKTGGPAPGAAILEPAAGEVARAWEVTDAMVARLAQAVGRERALLLVAGLPSHEQVIEERLQEARASLPPERAASLDRTLPDRRLRAICDRARIPYLPLQPAFAAATDPGRLFLDGAGVGVHGHWSAAGHALAAESMAPAIEARIAEIRAPLPSLR